MAGEDRSASDTLSPQSDPGDTPESSATPGPFEIAGGWRGSDDLVALLDRASGEPWSYAFFALARHIECIASDRPRLGRAIKLADDPVRFGQEPSLSFAPASLASIKPPVGDRPPRIMGHFFGLYGANGPMPLHLTEYIRDRVRNAHDSAMASFLDVFHHRLTTLFYRAWAVSQPTVAHDRPDDDRFMIYLASLIGLGSPSLLGRDAAPDIAKCHYAGRLGEHSKNAEGLEAIVQDFFGVPCRLLEFVGQWLELPDDTLCRLGDSPETGSLGTTAIVGSRVWDVQQRFRLELGPMGMADFQRLLPIHDSFAKLVAWVRNYCGFEYTWDVRLILRKDEVPKTQLGAGGMLGWTTWLQSKPATRDADELVLRPPDWDPTQASR